MSRESELYKDKIEVSLDGRQIFYLFFGGAVIVGLVFVLGVMVGRRVEARGHVDQPRASAAVDPLAALDRLEGGNGLSFQGTLRGGETPTSDVEKTIAAMKKKSEKDKKVDGKKDDKKVEEKKLDEKKLDEKKPDDKKADEKKAEEKKPEEKKFTLQLSSFQDKSEAQAYLESIKSAGFQPYVSEGAVDGKQYYRVRVGSYRTMDAANNAKADVEKATKKSAVVMKL